MPQPNRSPGALFFGLHFLRIRPVDVSFLFVLNFLLSFIFRCKIILLVRYMFLKKNFFRRECPFSQNKTSRCFSSVCFDYFFSLLSLGVRSYCLLDTCTQKRANRVFCVAYLSREEQKCAECTQARFNPFNAEVTFVQIKGRKDF